MQPSRIVRSLPCAVDCCANRATRQCKLVAIRCLMMLRPTPPSSGPGRSSHSSAAYVRGFSSMMEKDEERTLQFEAQVSEGMNTRDARA